MRIEEFLGLVSPDEGYIMLASPITTITGLAYTPMRHVAVEAGDYASVIRVATNWRNAQRAIYFGVASYAKPRVWNPAKKVNRADGTAIIGAWEYRTQRNAHLVKTLFLDIDIKDNDEHHRTYEDAIAKLREFSARILFPRPMVVATGGGLHCYWPLTDAVEKGEWKAVAEKFKAAAMHIGVRADHQITADCARVLRLPGSVNFKYDPPVPVKILNGVAAHPLADYAQLLDTFIANEGIEHVETKRPKSWSAPQHVNGMPHLPAGIEGNLGATSTPANLNGIVFGCPFMQKLVTTRGSEAREPQWRMGLGLAKFCEPQRPALLAVSDGYAGFTDAEMQAKVDNWTMGPSTCIRIHEVHTKGGWHSECPSCIHWGTSLTSPITLGRDTAPAPPQVDPLTEVTIPDPPEGYERRPSKDGIVQVVMPVEDKNGVKHFPVICPYDFYPVRVLRQTGPNVSEQTVWRMHLPRLAEPFDIMLPQATIADLRKLHGILLEKGLPVTPDQAKSMQLYMLAYIRKLNESMDRSKVYDRLGWHDKHTAFVMQHHIYLKGKVLNHDATSNLRATVKDGLHTEGTLADWIHALRFYGAPPMAQFRFFVYGAFGSPIFHMTGFEGVLVGARGETGFGKTTALEAAASVWGNPDALKFSGSHHGMTTNAFYNTLGTLHSLPMFWDETTQRDPEEMADLMLHISQGRGKERMKGHEHDGRTVTWATMVFSSANTDDVTRILSTRRDSEPHLMRLLSVEFQRVDTSTAMKLQADQFRRDIRSNFGHAGPLFIKYVVENYAAVQERLRRNQETFEIALKAKSPERYWTASLAAAFTGAQIAYHLQLIPFDPRQDLQWMIDHVGQMRESITDVRSTNEELLTEFLNEEMDNGLVIAASMSSNLDNTIREPRHELKYRYEFDTGQLFISRLPLIRWCEQRKIGFKSFEVGLLASGVLLSRNVQKVLGAGTKYTSGQSRCWHVDDKRLGVVRTSVQQWAQQQQQKTNVVPIQRKAQP